MPVESEMHWLCGSRKPTEMVQIQNILISKNTEARRSTNQHILYSCKATKINKYLTGSGGEGRQSLRNHRKASRIIKIYTYNNVLYWGLSQDRWKNEFIFRGPETTDRHIVFSTPLIPPSLTLNIQCIKSKFKKEVLIFEIWTLAETRRRWHMNKHMNKHDSFQIESNELDVCGHEINFKLKQSTQLKYSRFSNRSITK